MQKGIQLEKVNKVIITRVLGGILVAFLGVAEANTLSARKSDISGIYVLVSETTHIDKPRKETYARRPPTWTGIYLFLEGAYSVSLVSSTRPDDWIASFPKTMADLGYETETGTYSIKGKILRLNARLTLHPFGYNATTEVEFERKGDQLIITRRLGRRPEDNRTGIVVTVLRKVAAHELRSL